MDRSDGHPDEKRTSSGLQAAARLGLLALHSDNPEALMNEVAGAVADGLATDLSGVMMLQDGGNTLLLRAGIGWSEGVVGAATLAAGAIKSPAGFALASPEPVQVEDFEGDSRFQAAPIFAEHGIRSGVFAAMVGKEGPLGVLGAFAISPRSFEHDEIYFLQHAANALAGAVVRRRIEEDLRESEARAQAVLGTTVDGIITIDAHGRIESFNQAAERIFGYKAGEVIGKNVDVLMPSPYKEEHDEYLRSYRDTGRRKIIGIGREVAGRRKDGSTFPLDLAVSEVQLGDRRAFTGIVRDITDRRQLEKEILLISEQERRRIGQDLHDGLGQMLTGIGLITRNLARRLDHNDEEHASDVAEIADMIKEADEFARGLARGLVPVDLEESGLRYALQRLALGAEKLFGIRCAFEEVSHVLVEDNSVATHLYRIAQEAVSNAVKHGKAKHVRISLAAGEDQIRLRIHDDGLGFPQHATEEGNGSGMGVRIMRHRARILGAHIEIGPGIDGGTTITCTVRNHGGDIPMGGEEYGRN